MPKDVSARVEAIKEMAREKARIFRKETVAPSVLEEAALAWKKKEAEERQRQREALEKESSEGLSFRDALAKGVVEHDKRRLSAVPEVAPDLSRAESRNDVGWAQFSPWKDEEEAKKEKQIPLNTATVVAIRKKLIAVEWARALGKRPQDTRFHDLEREAALWRQRKEEEKIRKEEIRKRIERHKEVLQEALMEFGKKLRELKAATAASPEGGNQAGMDPNELSHLLEESLENAGEVFDIEWQEKGCLVWIEPWEEKKRRRISGFDIPVIYRIRIDENLDIASYEEVEDEEVIEDLKEELLTRPLRESLEGLSFKIDDEEKAREFLEDRLTDIGRLVNLERTEDGWLATVESWEEMRLRNMKREGKPPIVTDEIEVSWKDGKLEFVTEGNTEQSERVTEGNTEQSECTTEGSTEERSPELAEGQSPELAEGQSPEPAEGRSPELAEGQSDEYILEEEEDYDEDIEEEVIEEENVNQEKGGEEDERD